MYQHLPLTFIDNVQDLNEKVNVKMLSNIPNI